MSRRVGIVAIITAALVVLSTGYALYNELAATSAALTSQEARAVDLEQANARLVQEHTQLQTDFGAALAAIDKWQEALIEEQGSLSTTRAELAQTEVELGQTEEELATSEGALATTRGELEQATEELAAEKAAATAVAEELETLTSEHRELTGQYDDLTREVGTLEQLSEQVADLEIEIKQLEERRRPLILSSDRNGFACTGSMEPKITCLDEATYVTNPRPEEITVGTTIHFNPSCWLEEDDTYSDGIAHRVMDVKIENGVYSYWPKGDANREADGCWVPFDHVQGYIVEIHKDVRPENAALRNSVNEAARLEAEARSANEAAGEEYDSIIEQYCGPGVAAEDCSLPSPQYEIAIRAHQAWVDAYEEWEQYSDYHRCWVDSALSAIYWSTGEPPLYPPCLRPLIGASRL